MPDRPKSTSPPLPPPPEAVWRRTFLAQFASLEDRQALERFGDLLSTLAFGAGYLGDRSRTLVANQLGGVAADLDALAAFLEEIADNPLHASVSREELELCGMARDWHGVAADLAHEIRCRVREAEARQS